MCDLLTRLAFLMLAIAGKVKATLYLYYTILYPLHITLASTF
jgi:hypothetical protein